MKRTLAGLVGLAVVAAGALVPVDAAYAKKKKAEPAAVTTDIESCGKLPAGDRDSCISRSRPVTGTQLYRKWAIKRAEGAVAGAADKAKEAATAAVEKAKAVGKQAVAAIKGLSAGPTNIEDCGKVDPSLRDQCISRSKPVKGADLYKKWNKN